MATKRVQKQILAAQGRVQEEIHEDSDSPYNRGLASEGYAGGYYDALSDVLLLLNGIAPRRRTYWNLKDT